MDSNHYKAVLTCRRCGDKVYVHKWSEKITYWFCHGKDRRTYCGTFNDACSICPFRMTSKDRDEAAYNEFLLSARKTKSSKQTYP